MDEAAPVLQMRRRRHVRYLRGAAVRLLLAALAPMTGNFKNCYFVGDIAERDGAVPQYVHIA
jgi:hypothetical protein